MKGGITSEKMINTNYKNNWIVHRDIAKFIAVRKTLCTLTLWTSFHPCGS